MNVVATLAEGVLIGLLYGLLGAGFSFSFASARFVNFFYGGIVLWGMYLTVIGAKAGVPLWILGFGVIVVSALTGMLAYWLILNRVIDLSEELQIVGTFGLLIALVSAGQLVFTSDAYQAVTRLPSISLGSASIRSSVIVAGLGAAVCLAIVGYWLKATPGGKRLRAATNNEVGAVLSGVNVSRAHSAGQVVCFAMAGAGGFLLMLFGVVFPTQGLELGVLAFVVAVLGGMGHLPGAVAAGVLLGVLVAIGTLFLPLSMVPVARAAIIVVIMAIRPRGIFGAGVMGKH